MLQQVEIDGETYPLRTFVTPATPLGVVIDERVIVKFTTHALERMAHRNWSVEEVVEVLLKFPESEWKDCGVVGRFENRQHTNKLPRAVVVTVLDKHARKRVSRCVALQWKQDRLEKRKRPW